MAYERDILEDASSRRRPTRFTSVEVALGLVVEDRASGFCGDVVRWNSSAVTLRDRRQHIRHFTWKPGGFLVDGQPVTLVRPALAPVLTEQRTAAGAVVSCDGGDGAARVALASRIWVEGIHDAELIEHVWGDDLRNVGVVVEPMHGADELLAAVTSFAPSHGRRLGVLLDHLVDGSKESRLAGAARRRFRHGLVIAGHPFVDVWAGIRPGVLGLDAWPDVPPGVPWKEGLCRALGVELDGFWPRLRNGVTTYADLRPELVGAVERLIDHVADGESPVADGAG